MAEYGSRSCDRRRLRSVVSRNLAMRRIADYLLFYRCCRSGPGGMQIILFCVSQLACASTVCPGNVFVGIRRCPDRMRLPCVSPGPGG
jgi:hypothetical protein